MQYHHRSGRTPWHPAGEFRSLDLWVHFDRRLKLAFHGSRIASATGLLAYRELDHPPKRISPDKGGSVGPTHGEQEGSAYHVHFGRTCYHPLFLYNQLGDRDAAFASHKILATRRNGP